MYILLSPLLLIQTHAHWVRGAAVMTLFFLHARTIVQYPPTDGIPPSGALFYTFCFLYLESLCDG